MESQAGASARREYERRSNARKQRITQRFGRASGLVLALTNEPQSTKAWATGAAGEQVVASRLEPLTNLGAFVLHDRRIPGSRANIDHLVITNAGVTVIDTKKYQGKIEVYPRSLHIAGRNRTKLIDGLQRQVDIVAAHTTGVPVQGALCFVEGHFALLRFKTTRGFTVSGPRKLTKMLTAAHAQPTQISAAQTAHTLATTFTPA